MYLNERMRKTTTIFIALIFYFCRLAAQTDNLRFINFTDKDGLTEKAVVGAAQDTKGFMWFATGNGLFRYDGIRFKKIKGNNAVPRRISTNGMQTLYTDKQGMIWLSGSTAFSWLNPETGVVTNPDYSKPSVAKLADAIITDFYQDTKGTMWMATSGVGIARMNKADSSFTFFAPTQNTTAYAKAINQIIETPGNKLWMVSLAGLHEMNPANETITSYYVQPVTENSNWFTDGFYDSTLNCLWLGSYNASVMRFDLATHLFTTINVTSKFRQVNFTGLINVVAPYSSSSICFENLDVGFGIMDKKTGIISYAYPGTQDEFGFKTVSATKIVTDKENNKWICTSGSGLSLLAWQNQFWYSTKLVDHRNYSLQGLKAWPVPYSNDLLIGIKTGTGLCYYNSSTKQATILRHPENKMFSDNYGIHCFGTIRGDSIIGGDDYGLIYFNATSKKIARLQYTDQFGKPVSNLSGVLLVSKDNTVYASNYKGGVYIINPSNKSARLVSLWDVDPAAATGEQSNTLLPGLEDSEGNIWFTSTDGVYCRNSKTKIFTHYGYKAGTKNFIHQPVRMAEDNQHHYWITTVNDGLFELSLDEQGRETINNYNSFSAQPLSSDNCFGIVKDEKGILWIGTSAGLIQFDPVQKKQIRLLRQENGLASDYTGFGISLLPGNRLATVFFGSISIINLDEFNSNRYKVPVVLTVLKIQGREINLTTQQTADTTLILPYRQNSVELEFAALGFNNSRKNNYAYMLEGVDKEWVYSGQRNYVAYGGLPDGNYTFKVKAANNDGVWNEQELQLKIKIRSPFWKKWWFTALCLILVAGLVYWWNRYRESQVKKEERLKATLTQQIAETEMKALRAQMNPHFIFNSLNSIQKYILQNDHFAASQYLTRFSRLIRLILDHSNQNNILLSSELDLLKLYIEMESLRFDNKFNYEIKVNEGVNPETTEVPSMLIQPYIENAIWHGLLHKEEKGNLLIVFSKNTGSELVVTIQDDGIGREMASELKSKQVLKKKSYGMQITEDRIGIINKIQNINATCAIEDVIDSRGNVAGTKVVLTIPVKSLNK